MDSKLHAVCDQAGRPIVILLTKGRVGDYKGAFAMLPTIPTSASKTVIGDKGYDGDALRAATEIRSVERCIPPRRGGKNPCQLLQDYLSPP